MRARAWQGCEFKLLAPWLDRVCTEQITIEVHGCSRMRYAVGPAHVRFPKAHALLLRLDREFRIFHREPNPRFPDGCLEYSLQRRKPCPLAHRIELTDERPRDEPRVPS